MMALEHPKMCLVEDDWGKKRLVPVEVISNNGKSAEVVLGAACTLPGGNPGWRGEKAVVRCKFLVADEGAKI